jgi:hypothetical protein
LFSRDEGDIVVLVIGLVARTSVCALVALLAAAGCSSSKAGKPGSGGNAGAGGGGQAGMTSSGGGSGGTPPGAAGATAGGAPDAAPPAREDAGAGTADADGGTSDAVPYASRGCNADPGQEAGASVAHMIATSGTKAAGCADGVCGPWSQQREYVLTLPAGYDKSHAYPLVFEMPSCGANGNNVFTLKGKTPNADDTVIRVGLSPPPKEVGLPMTRPNMGCFDDAEGDDSVDFAFYETLYDELAAHFCIDRSRVFASGSYSGGRLANQLGCKYAGDATRPIRAVLVVDGALAANSPAAPTCTKSPLAGIWVHGVGDAENPFSGDILAINRALEIDGCEIPRFDSTMFAPYAIGGGFGDSICRRALGCPAMFPIVVCPLPQSRMADSDIAGPAFTTFIEMLENAPAPPP